MTGRSRRYVGDRRNERVDEYVAAVGIADSSLQVSYDFSLWPCCSEYRALAARGVDVGNVSLKRLSPFMGRGQLPTLVTALVKTILSSVMLRPRSFQLAEQVAWSYQDGDHFGKDL